MSKIAASLVPMAVATLMVASSSGARADSEASRLARAETVGSLTALGPGGAQGFRFTRPAEFGAETALGPGGARGLNVTLIMSPDIVQGEGISATLLQNAPGCGEPELFAKGDQVFCDWASDCLDPGESVSLCFTGPDGPFQVLQSFFTDGKGDSIAPAIPTRLATCAFDCSGAFALVPEIWPPNHQLVPVEISGVVDPSGGGVVITATGVTQDEPIEDRGDGSTCPDATIQDGVASVRMERAGGGNGRVYVISFTAVTASGASCSGSVRVCVPHDQDTGKTCVDDGQKVNSMGTCITGRMQGARPDDPGAVAGLRVFPVSAGVGRVEYSLEEESDVMLAVYDLAGRRVATLERSRQTAGSHAAAWNTAGLPGGMYFYRLQMGPVLVSRAVLVLK